MEIFGFNIIRYKKEPNFWTHVAIISTKRGKKTLFINGVENKEKDFTVDFWVNDENFAKLDNRNYIKQKLEE